MWHTSYIFQVLMVEIVKFYHPLSRTLFSTQHSYPFRHAAEMWPTSYIFWFPKYLTLVSLYLVLYSARNRNMTKIVYIFQVLKVKIVKCDHSLSHTLFGTRQKCDIHRRFFKFTEWKKNSFDHSLSRTLFSTQQKCDIHRTFFVFAEWNS